MNKPFSKKSKFSFSEWASTQLLFLVFCCIIVAVCYWAYVSKIAVVSVAEGEVIPSGQIKTIQHLEGGIIGSIYSLLQFIFSPILGHLSDQFGRRPILIFTIAGTTLSYLLWVFASSFNLLVLARVFGGIMGGNLAVATAAVADFRPAKSSEQKMKKEKLLRRERVFMELRKLYQALYWLKI
mgnify:CR=1 FL=1